MKVHIRQIPPEGLHLEGSVPAAQLDLPSEGMRPAGDLECHLDVGLSGGGLFATGTASIDMEFDCVSCLNPFRRTIHLEGIALQKELTGPETVDLTPELREDTLLAFPTHPRCDWDGKTRCPGAGRGTPGDPSPGGSAPEAWSALDRLKLKTKE